MVRRFASAVLRSRLTRSLLRSSPRAVSHFMPVVRALRNERRTTNKTIDPRYCYAVFLRHHALLAKLGAHRPGTVLEFGPGDTIGAGLCWLLSGANRYYALDAHRYASVEDSLQVFEGVVELFGRREPLPPEFPDMLPAPRDQGYRPDPVDLSAGRLEEIRSAIRRMDDREPSGEVQVRYLAPWTEDSPIPPGSVDLATSQAVLEHVVDLPQLYRAMARWVRPGGIISHNIDIRSHGTSFDENGHWAYSDRQWRRANNKQAYRAINRAPRSTHLRLMAESGFEVVSAEAHRELDGIAQRHLAPEWTALSEEDRTCSVLHVVARRR